MEAMSITLITKEFILMMILDKNISALKLGHTSSTLTCLGDSRKFPNKEQSKKKLSWQNNRNKLKIEPNLKEDK